MFKSLKIAFLACVALFFGFVVAMFMAPDSRQGPRVRERNARILKDLKDGRFSGRLPRITSPDVILETYLDENALEKPLKDLVLAEELCWQGYAAACRLAAEATDPWPLALGYAQPFTREDHESILGEYLGLSERHRTFAMLACIQGDAQSCYIYRWPCQDLESLAKITETFCDQDRPQYCTARGQLTMWRNYLPTPKSASIDKTTFDALVERQLDYFKRGCEGEHTAGCEEFLNYASPVDPFLNTAIAQLKSDCEKFPEYGWTCQALIRHYGRYGRTDQALAIAKKACAAESGDTSQTCFDSALALAHNNAREASIGIMKEYCRKTDGQNDRRPASLDCPSLLSLNERAPEAWSQITKVMKPAR